jgi:hypothetical protein
MSLFNYTLPSGAEFTVRGPVGATQAEADRIFYEQVAAGALVGYEAGQTLTSIATQITKFELSRLDRGTAGVDTPTVLAIVQGLPVVAGIPNLSNVPLTSPISDADIVNIKGDDFAPDAIGANGVTALTEYQTQKILAQIANLVDQNTNQITQDKGIGKYGFTAYALEQAGLVKPGTSLRFFSVESDDFVSVMSSPSVWTGKDGVYSLDDLLSNLEVQNRVQTSLMQQGYDNLLTNGTITTPPQNGKQLSTGQVFTNLGLQPALALTLNTGLASLSNTTREALSSSIRLDELFRATSATSVNLNTIGSGAVNSLVAGLGNQANLNIAGIGAGITNQITGEVGALVANASKFGSQATTLWAKAGGLGINSDVGSAFGGLNRLNNALLTKGAIPNINSITGQLTNLIPGSLTNLTSNLNVFGKASTFATNFANPAGALNSLPGVGTLTAGITGQIGTLTAGLPGQLTGALTGLTGQLTGALTGVLGNFSAVAGLFGGGGDLVSGTQVAGGFNNTVNRATVDAAFARIVGSSKVPLPVFQYPSLASLAPRLDIQQAQNFLRNLSGSPGERRDSPRPTFGQTVTV